MGKTKTALIGEAPAEQKSGKEAYEDRMKKKDAAAAKVDAGTKAKVRAPGQGGGQRVVAIEEGPIVTEEATVPEASEEKKRVKKIKVRGRKYQENYKKIDKSKNYPLSEAIKLVKDSSYSKFDGTLELHILVRKIGLSENVVLPHFAAKEKKVEIADDKTIEKLKTGKIDFDVLLATADMMPKLVPFAKVLGPKGLMPNPKTGTLIKNVKEADLSAQAGKFSGNSTMIKTQKDAPVIHTVIGKVSQKDEEIAANTKVILDAIGTKQILKAYMKSTMSPSVKLSVV